jgi:IS1 family transposase
MTGVSKPTVLKLLVEAGAVALRFQDEVFRNLNCQRIQVDELWAFVYAKQKNVTPRMAGDRTCGDVWLWTAIDADTKLVPSWTLGQRDAATAHEFMQDLAARLSNRAQLTSDGHKPYLRAVDDAFGNDIDYAMLIKVYGESTEPQKRYSPAVCLSCEPKAITGNPDPKHISTSYVERQNLSLRMATRRYTRLTNAFIKKIENHAAAVALYYFSYNFIKIHSTLRITPAMAAGVTDRLFEVSDLVALLEAEERRLERVAA